MSISNPPIDNLSPFNPTKFITTQALTVDYLDTVFLSKRNITESISPETTFQNLVKVSDVRPKADNAHTLGNPSYRFSDVQTIQLNGTDVGSFLTSNITTPINLNNNTVSNVGLLSGSIVTILGQNNLILSSPNDDIQADNNIRILNGFSLYADNVLSSFIEATTLSSPGTNNLTATAGANIILSPAINSVVDVKRPISMNSNNINNCTQVSHGTQLTLFGGETLTLNCGTEIDVKKPFQMNGVDIKDANNVNAINYHQKFQNNVYIPMTRYTCEYMDSLTYNLPNPMANVQTTFKGSFLGPGAYSLHATAHYHIKYAFFLSTTTAGGIFTLSLVIGGTSVLITSTTALAIGSYMVEYDIYMYIHSGTLTTIQTTLYSKLTVSSITASLILSFPANTSNQGFTNLVNGVVSPGFTIQSSLASNQWSGNRRSYLFTRDA